ncbi:MAG: hypothetical protein ACI8WB_001026 [Phenylobacterium sp.]|jgi:hypothetical protein
MIDNALNFIREVAEGYASKLLPDASGEKKVVLTAFADDSGKTKIPAEAVGLSLLNIEQERTFIARGMGQIEPQTTSTPGQISFVHRPVDLNLQLMFTANFSNYQESLKHIACIVQCFQSNPQLLLPCAQPGLPEMQLVMELNTLPLEQQHYIWSMIGLRYLPSVVYRMRMLRIQDSNKQIVEPAVQRFSVQNNGQNRAGGVS